MYINMNKPLQSSFLSCDKDSRLILEKLFVENRQYARELKKLLIVNTKDCLDNPRYNELVDKINISEMIEKQYIRTAPIITMGEHEEVQSYIVMSFDNFIPSTNPQFRDCSVHFDIICHNDCWDIENYRLRPLKIAGYIDGILNNARLTGIGTFQFAGCNELVLSEVLSGYTLTYLATHGSDDLIEDE